VDKQTDLISRLQDEADMCRNDGASDIAALLDEAVEALLIAAAPDLLEALDRLLQSGDVRDAADAGALKQARAAIAKAVGSAA
jgi:hypothetical protein